MKRQDFLGGLAAAPSMAAASWGRADAQDLTTVRAGYLGISTDAPVWIADQNGYFREQGLKIEFVKFTSSETMMPLLSVGQLDVGNGAPGASLYNAVIHGVDVRAVANASTDPPGFGWSKLLIRTDLVKSGKFKGIKDLKGMTIGGAARASSSSAQVARLIAKAGLKFTDVKRAVLPYPEHVIAFQNGAFEAALTIEPFATLAIESGAAVGFMGNDQFYPNQEVSCVLCSAQLIKSKRDVIVRYLRGFLKGVRYYSDALRDGKLAGPNSDVVAKLIAAHTGANEALIRRTTPVAMDPNGHLNLVSMREDLTFYQEQGFIEGPISVDQVIDISLAPEALKAIGVYKRKY